MTGRPYLAGIAAALAATVTVAAAHPAGPGVGPAVSEESPTDTVSDFIQSTFEGPEGRILPYRLYVPSSAEEAPALVVLLHGCTQDGADFAAGTRANDWAEDLGFLVLYPEQTSARHPQHCWNWFDARERRPTGPETSLVTGLIARVVDDRGVDPERVYLAGISAGASMASLLAATHPTLFDAVGLHSGLEFGAASSLEAAVAALQQGGPDPEESARAAVDAMGARARGQRVVVVHGLDDAVVRPVNGEQAARQWAESWRRIEGSTLSESTATREVEGRTVRSRSWTDEGGREVVALHLVEGLGHAWSGGDPAGSYADPAGPDATAWMLAFFGLAPADDTR